MGHRLRARDRSRGDRCSSHVLGGISGAPETFVVNSKGVIVDKWPAPLTDDDADRLVRELNKAG